MTGNSATRPPLAIVIVSLIGAEAVARTLRSIRAIDAECVVVGSTPRSAPRSGPTGFIHADVPVPLKRTAGIDATDSDWVALLEDTCDVGPGWQAAFNEIAGQTEFDVAGGPVTIAGDLPPPCMALACLEYAAYAAAPGQLTVAADRIAGLNLLYRRSALPVMDAGTGLIESEVNARILHKGGKLALHPGLAVTYRAADHASARFNSRFSHGRIYGGGQRDRIDRIHRAIAIVKCVALPFVFYARAVRGIPADHRFPVRARLWILWLALAWSLGELCGVVAGRGASLATWR